MDFTFWMLTEQRDFNYDEEEKFFLIFMHIIFVVFALLFVWGVFSHLKQINLINTGKSYVGTLALSGDYVKYTTENGRNYYVDITGMVLDDFEETVMVYYKENPAAAVPATSTKFFLFIYGVAVMGMCISLFLIKRTRKSIKKNKLVV